MAEQGKIHFKNYIYLSGAKDKEISFKKHHFLVDLWVSLFLPSYLSCQHSEISKEIPDG